MFMFIRPTSWQQTTNVYLPWKTPFSAAYEQSRPPAQRHPCRATVSTLDLVACHWPRPCVVSNALAVTHLKCCRADRFNLGRRASSISVVSSIERNKPNLSWKSSLVCPSRHASIEVSCCSLKEDAFNSSILSFIKLLAKPKQDKVLIGLITH